MSVNFEDEACGGGGVVSEEDLETRSICSLGSSPSSPQELLSPCPFSSFSSSSCTSSSPPTPSSSPSLQSRPCSLDLPSTVSLSDFGVISPVLGPRSECSGASSPECDLERGECGQPEVVPPRFLHCGGRLKRFTAAGDRAEGAEKDVDNAPPTNNNGSSSSFSTKKSFSLEAHFSFLNLRRPRALSCSQKAGPGQTVVLVK